MKNNEAAIQLRGVTRYYFTHSEKGGYVYQQWDDHEGNARQSQVCVGLGACGDTLIWNGRGRLEAFIRRHMKKHGIPHGKVECPVAVFEREKAMDELLCSMIE